MDKHREERVREALEKTFHAYEDLISDVHKLAIMWNDYGYSHACRLCKSTVYDCKICPIRVHPPPGSLLIDTYNCGQGVADIGGFSDMVDKIRIYLFHTTYENEELLRITAKARLKILIKTAKKNGWEYR